MTSVDIDYRSDLHGVSAEKLRGFFVGWANPPSEEQLLLSLQGSYAVVLAVDRPSLSVVGLISAVSDGFLSAYIPLLEVLPEYQGRGIGTELVERMMGQLSHMRMVDLVCDEPLTDFYSRFGMCRARAMIIRRNELP